jgi:hypothetical protein
MIAKYVKHYRDATNAYLVVSVDELINGAYVPTPYTGSVALSAITASVTDQQIVNALLAACKSVRDASGTKTPSEKATAFQALRHDQAMAVFAASSGADAG